MFAAYDEAHAGPHTDLVTRWVWYAGETLSACGDLLLSSLI